MSSVTDRIYAYSMDTTARTTIVCLNCHGKGFQTWLGLDGTYYPVVCRVCGGSGSQRVRP